MPVGELSSGRLRCNDLARPSPNEWQCQPVVCWGGIYCTLRDLWIWPNWMPLSLNQFIANESIAAVNRAFGSAHGADIVRKPCFLRQDVRHRPTEWAGTGIYPGDTTSAGEDREPDKPRRARARSAWHYPQGSNESGLLSSYRPPNSQDLSGEVNTHDQAQTFRFCVYGDAVIEMVS